MGNRSFYPATLLLLIVSLVAYGDEFNTAIYTTSTCCGWTVGISPIPERVEILDSAGFEFISYEHPWGISLLMETDRRDEQRAIALYDPKRKLRLKLTNSVGEDIIYESPPLSEQLVLVEIKLTTSHLFSSLRRALEEGEKMFLNLEFFTPEGKHLIMPTWDTGYPRFYASSLVQAVKEDRDLKFFLHRKRFLADGNKVRIHVGTGSELGPHDPLLHDWEVNTFFDRTVVVVDAAPPVWPLLGDEPTSVQHKGKLATTWGKQKIRD